METAKGTRQKSPIFSGALYFFLLTFTCCLGKVWAKDDGLTDDALIVKTESNHRLLLPKDWPVEQRDGQIVPVPIEEYLSMKFGQVRERFSELDQQLATMDHRIQQLEEERKGLLARIRALEEHAH